MLFRRVETQPWRATFGMVSTVQVFYMVLDLAVNTGVDASWHNAVVTIEFLSAVFLASYQAIRVSAFLRGVAWAQKETPTTPPPPSPLPSANEPEASNRRQIDPIRKCMWLLSTSLLLQIVIVILAACSFRLDSPPIEWAVFAVALVWSVVNAWSFVAVQAVAASAPAEDDDDNSDDGNSNSSEPDAAAVSPFEAVVSAFRSTWILHTWPRERCRPWLYGAVLLAASHAAMVGLQGIMVDWLAGLSSGMYDARQSGAATVRVGGIECAATGMTSRQDGDIAGALSCETHVSWYAYGLVAVWFAATACHAMYKAVNSSLKLRLELWLRDRAFVVRREMAAVAAAAARSNNPEGEETQGHPDLTELQAVYEVDIDRALRVHTALQEIFVNVLLVVSNFAALLVLSPKVGAISLSLVSLWATVSGPPSCYSDSNAKPTPSIILEGSGLLQESPARCADDEGPRLRHRKQVMVPLEARWLRRSVYSDSAADIYVGVFAAFLTITVIVCVAWDVAEAEMSPYRVLAVLFVLVHLLRAATSLPALSRQVASNWSALKNVDRTLRLGGERRMRKLRVLKELETSSASADDDVEQPAHGLVAAPVRKTVP
jgi:hypothetical protein